MLAEYQSFRKSKPVFRRKSGRFSLDQSKFSTVFLLNLGLSLVNTFLSAKLCQFHNLSLNANSINNLIR